MQQKAADSAAAAVPSIPALPSASSASPAQSSEQPLSLEGKFVPPSPKQVSNAAALVATVGTSIITSRLAVPESNGKKRSGSTIVGRSSKSRSRGDEASTPTSDRNKTEHIKFDMKGSGGQRVRDKEDKERDLKDSGSKTPRERKKDDKSKKDDKKYDPFSPLFDVV